MLELSSYRLTDFIPLEAEVYARLFTRINSELWPWPPFGLLLGLGLVWALWRRPRERIRRISAALVLASIWVGVGYQFHAQLLAELSWVAKYFAWAFYLQAIGVLVWGFYPANPDHRASPITTVALLAGVVLILAYPLLWPAGGRNWQGAELFATAPDPTALVTLSLVMLGRRRYWWCVPVPVLWCGLSSALWWGLDRPLGLVPALGAMVLVLLAITQFFLARNHRRDRHS